MFEVNAQIQALLQEKSFFGQTRGSKRGSFWKGRLSHVCSDPNVLYYRINQDVHHVVSAKYVMLCHFPKTRSRKPVGDSEFANQDSKPNQNEEMSI